MTHIDLATEEDKADGIDHWARLFKISASSAMHVRKRLKESIITKNIAEKDAILVERDAALAEKNATLDVLVAENARLKALIAAQTQK